MSLSLWNEAKTIYRRATTASRQLRETDRESATHFIRRRRSSHSHEQLYFINYLSNNLNCIPVNLMAVWNTAHSAKPKRTFAKKDRRTVFNHTESQTRIEITFRLQLDGERNHAGKHWRLKVRGNLLQLVNWVLESIHPMYEIQYDYEIRGIHEIGKSIRNARHHFQFIHP